MEEKTYMQADIIHDYGRKIDLSKIYLLHEKQEKKLGFVVATRCHYDFHCDYLVNFQADECYLIEKDDGVLKIVHAPIDAD